MTLTQATTEETSTGGAMAAFQQTWSRTIRAADVNEVMREQLDFLIEHAERGTCGCRQCHRYLSARAVLMEIFSSR